MVPDIDLIDSLLTNQDPNWVTITFRGIGEMEDQQAVANIDPALALAGNNAADIEYWNAPAGQWQAAQPQPDAAGRGFWQDRLGTTHHEAGTLFMGAAGASVTDSSGKFHGKDNVYVAGPALFPT